MSSSISRSATPESRCSIESEVDLDTILLEPLEEKESFVIPDLENLKQTVWNIVFKPNANTLAARTDRLRNILTSNKIHPDLRGVLVVEAAINGEHPLISVLLEQPKISKEKRGEAIWMAAKGGHIEAVSILFTKVIPKFYMTQTLASITERPDIFNLIRQRLAGFLRR